MAYQAGFTYVNGPVRYMNSTVSSTATFKARNPVTFDARGFLIEAASDSTAIFGIACNNAADSLGGVMASKILVEIPEPETIYATVSQTGVAASAYSVGKSYSIEKSGNYLRIDTDSAATAFLMVIGDQLGTYGAKSDDSSVFVRWLAERIIHSSSASIPVFAEL